MAFQFIQPVYAQCNPGGEGGSNLGDCLTLDGTTTVQSVYRDPASIINLVVYNLFVLGGILLFLMVFYSGFKFVSGGTKGKDEAKTIFTTALAGMIVMFSAYWIVAFVEYITGVSIF